jgi:hypothetical protein
VLALRRLLVDAGVRPDAGAAIRYTEESMEALLAYLRANRMFSITGLRLA